MAPYEALYGRPCRTVVCWNEVGEWKLLGPELLQQTTENVKLIRNNLKAARDSQKSYANKRRRELEFEVGDRVFLRLSPWKGILRFRRKGKLSPRYIEPYEIVERVDPIAYKLQLPMKLTRIHDVFHVSMLRKYVLDPMHILAAQSIQLKEDLSYEEEAIEILDKKDQVAVWKIKQATHHCERERVKEEVDLAKDENLAGFSLNLARSGKSRGKVINLARSDKSC
ncbi:uncharacterized protein LOC120076226 [Benincasa hispida]|uniref:uncharacterized protein LOC120076226 n=1 Tax=Benincasa hispida TaxID=102211 RepID=UPI0018FFE793|nr:uncharacterized protein LOC120076226 [Benincasa hispida]